MTNGHDIEKATIPLTQTVFLSKDAMGVKNIDSYTVKVFLDDAVKKDGGIWLGGIYEINMDYRGIEGKKLYKERIALSFKTEMPTGWRQTEESKIRAALDGKSLEVLAPYVLEFSGELSFEDLAETIRENGGGNVPEPFKQNENSENGGEKERYVPDNLVKKVLADYEDIVSETAGQLKDDDAIIDLQAADGLPEESKTETVQTAEQPAKELKNPEKNNPEKNNLQKNNSEKSNSENQTAENSGEKKVNVSTSEKTMEIAETNIAADNKDSYKDDSKTDRQSTPKSVGDKPEKSQRDSIKKGNAALAEKENEVDDTNMQTSAVGNSDKNEGRSKNTALKSSTANYPQTAEAADVKSLKLKALLKLRRRKTAETAAVAAEPPNSAVNADNISVVEKTAEGVANSSEIVMRAEQTNSRKAVADLHKKSEPQEPVAKAAEMTAEKAESGKNGESRAVLADLTDLAEEVWAEQRQTAEAKDKTDKKDDESVPAAVDIANADLSDENAVADMDMLAAEAEATADGEDVEAVAVEDQSEEQSAEQFGAEAAESVAADLTDGGESLADSGQIVTAGGAQVNLKMENDMAEDFMLELQEKEQGFFCIKYQKAEINGENIWQIAEQ